MNLTGYRTYIVSAIVAAFGALAILDWNSILNDPKAGTVAVVAAIIMAVMRTFTTTPPGKTEPTPIATPDTKAE